MSAAPRLVVLGSAQDGGLPHAGCLCANCTAARIDRAIERLPASLGIAAGGASLMIDATSAFERQLYRLWRAADRPRTGATRFDPPETIVLTHAHSGHYIGLWQLDRSVMAAKGVRVVASPAMIEFLAEHEPWRRMQRDGFIRLTIARLDEPFEALPGVRLTLFPVPHRSEWGVDTLGVRIDGPERSALYIPDIDSWDAWDRDIVAAAGSVDLALLDGCFWEPFHIPGVPHPPIRESLERLAPVVANGRTRVAFTHLNHSNPVCDPRSAAAAEVAGRGFAIVAEDARFAL